MVEDSDSRGGWGWVIVAAIFFITWLSFGATYSIGIFFDALFDEFGCTKSEISMVASISTSLQCFLGPVVSMLLQRFQIRTVVICGTILVSLGFIISVGAPNVTFLIFSFGVVGGIGMSMVYLPVMILLSFYFHRKRSTATAVACLGIYVGAFLYPYIIRILVNLYDWRGAMLIIGALALNSVALAILLRPVTNTTFMEPVSGKYLEEIGTTEGDLKLASQDLEAFIAHNVTGCHITGEPSSIPNSIHQLENVLCLDDQGNTAECLHQQDPLNNIPSDSRADMNRHSSRLQDNRQHDDKTGEASHVSSLNCVDRVPEDFETASPLGEENKYDVPLLRQDSATNHSVRSRDSGASNSNSLAKVGPKVLPRQISFARQMSEKPTLWQLAVNRRLQTASPVLDRKTSKSGDLPQSPMKHIRPKLPHKNKPLTTSKILSFGNAVNSSSIISIPIFDPFFAPDLLFRGLSYEEHREPEPSLEMPRKSSLKNEQEEQIATANPQLAVIAEGPLPSAGSVVKKNFIIMNLIPFFRHFNQSGFSSFVASNFMLSLVYFTPPVFISHWGQQLGFSKEETTFLLSLIGMGNVVGRPLLAASADKWVRWRVPLFAAMVGTAGIVTAVAPLFPEFYFLAFVMFQFGFLAGTSQTLLTPIIADMVPLSDLSHAFSVLILVDGVAMLIGPPLLALLPSYDFTFSLTGIVMMMSSLALFGPFYVHQWCISESSVPKNFCIKRKFDKSRCVS